MYFIVNGGFFLFPKVERIKNAYYKCNKCFKRSNQNFYFIKIWKTNS